MTGISADKGLGESMPTDAELSETFRILEQTGAVRQSEGVWVHETKIDAQKDAEELLARRFGRERARRLIRLALAETSTETPPDFQ
ncbi:hypothetical protein [Roseibium salinum]|uniref:Uncharacterized protein n=1 Tax=Roseibium salinum TaxID=1604349 RepID=A0ABT3R636_9HYPH|nr:hypothetical protein [Roseibium sp. DSM 29163]MCX2724477.1 hypothetical protein [Roseibium sp. DSM 29163]MDN3721525.1 hypothetical protein [Roseibium salinum]